jgi:class 3 adenylate cyclase/tetratricopeptide (TPR) repeat protein/biotin operon repressor
MEDRDSEGFSTKHPLVEPMSFNQPESPARALSAFSILVTFSYTVSQLRVSAVTWGLAVSWSQERGGVDFRVLGSLQVIGRNAVPVDLPSVSQRRLVCLLLVRASVVSADSLADHLEISPGALRTTVSRLRRTLGFATLVSVPPGYELRADAIDAREFEQCLAAAAATDDAGAARRLLEKGVALWRGDAYAEFAHEPWAMTESRRLAELRAGAVEDLAGILLDRSEWSAAIATLEPFIATHPYRDRPRGLLMQALADSGRRVDALRAFQDYRRFLIDEVGTEPSPELVGLDRDIARQGGSSTSVPSAEAKNTDNVVVLFTDIVDFTHRVSPPAPDVVDHFRHQLFSVLRQAVAEAGGSEVKSIGHQLMVVFDSSSAAMSCAVAMQQGVERDNRAQGRTYGLRVGLSGGEVTSQGGEYYGIPVLEAAGLCAASDGGQILATEVVHAMAGRRSPLRHRSLGQLVLSDISRPVDTVEVLWESLGESRNGAVPLPVRVGQRLEAVVVGRAAELEKVAESAKRVAGGNGREVLLVSGEAGLGKTTLVAEGARAAFTAGACVLFGHCEEDLATPYQLFTEALGHYVTHCAEERLRAHVEVHGSELVRLIPALSTRIPDLPPTKATDSDSDRYLLFTAVVGLLSQASEAQPIVLMLDDLQWADAGSLDLLRHVIATDQPLAVLVLGTYRDTELLIGHPFLETLAALHRQVNVTRLELSGLDDTAVASFMEAVAGRPLDDSGISFAHALHRETDGNPFFVSEILHHLSETGALLGGQTGRWLSVENVEAVGLPVSIREVIGARVGRLGPVAGRVLSLAAVIGRDFDIEVLTQAAEISEEDLLDLLDTAVAAALVREGHEAPGHYAFAHALIQQSLYEDLGPTRRARAHRQVAVALEHVCRSRPGPRVGEIARHWFIGRQLQDLAKALDYSRRAADAALEALAPGDALRYYTQALDLHGESEQPDPVLGIDLAIGLGIAQRQTGNPAFRETLLAASHQAVTIGDSNRLVVAALANHRGWYSAAAALDTDKIEILEMTLDRLSPDDRDRALVLATLCSELAIGTPLERRRELADEALELAESSGDDAVMVQVLNSTYYALHVPPLLEQSLDRTADALVRAEHVDDAMARFLALHNRHLIAYVAGDFDEMDRCIDAMGSLAELLDQPMLQWTMAYVRATQALIAGDSVRAEAHVMEALQLGTDSGQPDTILTFGLQFMATNFQKGTLVELIPLIEQMAVGMTENLGMVNAALVLALSEGSRNDEVRMLLEEYSGTGFNFLLDCAWSIGMCGFAEGAIEVADPRFAAPLFDHLAPWSAQWCTTGITAQGPISHYVAGLATVLGRFDEAEAYFAQAASMSTAAGARFFSARTDLSWGKMLAERHSPGDPERAREFLTRSHTVAAANGYANVERRALAALQLLDA